MQIRDKLTLLFMGIVALILGGATIAIYYSSAIYRQEEFYSRMESKARNVAQLLIDVEEVDVNLLYRMEKNNPVSLPKEKIIIIDYQDQVLYNSGDFIPLKLSSALLNKIRLEEKVRFNEGQYDVLGFLYADKFERVVVLAAAVDIYGYSKLTNLRNVLLLVFGAGIVLTFFSGRFLSHRALKSITTVVGQVELIGVDNLSYRLDEGNGKDEIAKLLQTFNALLHRLESTFEMQKNFIANASHELRTPLTAITGQLEVSLMQKRTKDEYVSALKSVLEDMTNLNRLSNRLLLLAQTSTEVPTGSFVKLRIDEVLWDSVAEIDRRSCLYKTTINFDKGLDEDKMWILGNEQLLKTVFINLMDNGCKYSKTHEVNIELLADGQFLQIIFSDKGIGIPPEDLINIFEPFHRGSNVQKIQGHGIGLSLVKQILKLHKSNISVKSAEGEGSDFKIFFPAIY